MKISDEHFSYLIGFLSNLEYVKDKNSLDKVFGTENHLEMSGKMSLLKGNASEVEDFSFVVPGNSELFENFSRFEHIITKDGLSLFWGNVGFTVEGKEYYLFLKELMIERQEFGYQVSSKNLFPQLNATVLRNYPVHPEKFRHFRSFLERVSISPFDDETYAILLDEFKALFSNNESSQNRLNNLNLNNKKGFFVGESNSFNLFLNLNF